MASRAGDPHVELLVIRLAVEVLELAQDHDERLEALERAYRGEVDPLAELAAATLHLEAENGQLGGSSSLGTSRPSAQIRASVSQTPESGFGPLQRLAGRWQSRNPADRPEDYRTRAEYRWARKLWLRSHGGSFIGTLALALFFGALSRSTVVLLGLVLLAVVGTIVARSRP